jgi:anaphase-promoting complex subunit 8
MFLSTHETCRPREAIDCFKRAQIEADPHDILLDQKIADLYEALGDRASAAQHHKRVVETCRSAGMTPLSLKSTSLMGN